MRWPRYTTRQLLLLAALCGLIFGLAKTSWRANDYSQINALRYSPGGKRLAAHYISGMVRVWNVESGRVARVADIPLHNPWSRLGIEQLTFLDDDTLLDVEIQAIGPTDKEDGAIRTIDLRSGRIDRPIRFDASYYLANYAAAGDTVALVTLPLGTIDCYSLKHRRRTRQLRVAAEPATPMMMTPDGGRLVAIDQGSRINVVDLATDSTLRTFSASGAGLLAISPDGCRLAVSSSLPRNGRTRSGLSSAIMVHQIGLANDSQQITPGLMAPWIEFSANGNRLAIADQWDVVIYDLDDSRALSHIALQAAPRSPMSSLERGGWRSQGQFQHYAFSPDGTTLASFDGGDVLVWDVSSGQLKARLVGQIRLPHTLLYCGGFVGWAIAWGVVARRRQPVHTEFKPPLELKLVWGLVLIGGLLAVAVPVALLVTRGPLLWPGIYYALGVGLVLIVGAAGRRTARLERLPILQMFNLLACDWVNFVLGVIAHGLLRRPHVQGYLYHANHQGSMGMNSAPPLNPQPPTIRNFGGNLEFQPSAAFFPRSDEEVLDILREHRGRRIRAIGRLHSWSRVVVADEVLLDLRHLDSVRVDTNVSDQPIATIGGGCQIKRALSELDRLGGWTLPSVGLISEQTIAGAISTGTHGSGKHSLSHYVSAVRLATYDAATGEPLIRTIDAGPELLAARCSLGCLGIILSVQVLVRPQYFVEEHLRQHQTLDEVLAAEAEYPLAQFYLLPWRWTYLGQHRRETPGPRSWHAPLYRAYWFTFIDVGLHVLLLLLVQLVRSPALIRTFYRWLVMLTVIRGWRVVDRSQDQLIMEHELFRHIEIELFVTRWRLADALAHVRTAIEQSQEFYTHHYAICIRQVLADETLISMSSCRSEANSSGEASYAISLISYARPAARAGFFRFADALARSMVERFDARPHWGKHCPLTAAEAECLYPRLAEFREICRQSDPAGVFRNAWTAHVIMGEPAATPRA